MMYSVTACAIGCRISFNLFKTSLVYILSLRASEVVFSTIVGGPWSGIKTEVSVFVNVFSSTEGGPNGVKTEGVGSSQAATGNAFEDVSLTAHFLLTPFLGFTSTSISSGSSGGSSSPTKSAQSCSWRRAGSLDSNSLRRK
jgi:hypothetical protein